MSDLLKYFILFLKIRPEEYISLKDDIVLDITTLATNINTRHIKVEERQYSIEQLIGMMEGKKRLYSDPGVAYSSLSFLTPLLAMRTMNGDLYLLDGHKRVLAAQKQFATDTQRLFTVFIVEEADCRPYCANAENFDPSVSLVDTGGVFKILKHMLRQGVFGKFRRDRATIDIVRAQAIPRRVGGVRSTDAEKRIIDAICLTIEGCKIAARQLGKSTKRSHRTPEYTLFGHRYDLSGEIADDFAGLVAIALAPPSTSKSPSRLKLDLGWDHIERNCMHRVDYTWFGFKSAADARDKFRSRILTLPKSGFHEFLEKRYERIIILVRALVRIRWMQAFWNTNNHGEDGKVGISTEVIPKIEDISHGEAGSTTAIGIESFMEIAADIGDTLVPFYPEHLPIAGFIDAISYFRMACTMRQSDLAGLVNTMDPRTCYFLLGRLILASAQHQDQDPMEAVYKKMIKITKTIGIGPAYFSCIITMKITQMLKSFEIVIK